MNNYVPYEDKYFIIAEWKMPPKIMKRRSECDPYNLHPCQSVSCIRGIVVITAFDNNVN